MLLWYRIRDSRLWPVAVIALTVAVFGGGFLTGRLGERSVTIEGYRRSGDTTVPMTYVAPIGSTTTLAPTSTFKQLSALDSARLALSDVLTEANRNGVPYPTVEMIGRFFNSTVAAGLIDEDGDGVDDDGAFSYVTSETTVCVRVWGKSAPQVLDGACE